MINCRWDPGRERQSYSLITNMSISLHTEDTHVLHNHNINFLQLQ